MLQNILKYFVMEPRAAIKKLRWATDGGDSDIKVFKRFILTWNHGLMAYQSASNKWSTVHQSMLVKSVNRNLMLLQQFLIAIRQVLSEFFIFQQDSARAHGAFRRSAFLPITSPDVCRFKNIKADSPVNLQ